jgi:hypothetical protein
MRALMRSGRLGRRTGASVVAALAVTGLGLAPAAVAGAASARQASAPWRVVATTKSAFLSGLVAPSRHSIWALGTGIVSGQPGKGFPFGLHWNGRRWSKVSFPAAIAKTGIGCAAASSPRDVWAFAGTSSAGSGAAAAGALRLVNGRWKLVKRFPAGIVTGCLVVDATDVWVFGDAHVAPGTGTWHLHGRTWTHLAFHGFLLDSASAIGKNDVWGEGANSFLRPVVARWNGRSWVRNTKLAVALPAPSQNLEMAITGITATSDKNVWVRVLVTRFSGSKRTDSYIVLHWTGSAWHRIGTANAGYYLPGAVRGGDGSWWSFLPVDPFGSVPNGVRHRVHGRWVKVPVKIGGCLSQRPFLLAPAGSSSTMLGLQTCSGGKVADVLARGSIR